MTTRVHMSMSVRGFLRNSRFPADYEGVFLHDDGRPMTPAEARDHLLDELSMGHELIRVGKCDNFDPKLGCLGHEEQERG